jgi:hypothetical protein
MAALPSKDGVVEVFDFPFTRRLLCWASAGHVFERLITFLVYHRFIGSPITPMLRDSQLPIDSAPIPQGYALYAGKQPERGQIYPVQSTPLGEA